MILVTGLLAAATMSPRCTVDALDMSLPAPNVVPIGEEIDLLQLMVMKARLDAIDHPRALMAELPPLRAAATVEVFLLPEADHLQPRLVVLLRQRQGDLRLEVGYPPAAATRCLRPPRLLRPALLPRPRAGGRIR